MIAERSAERHKLPGLVATLMCIAALVGVYYVFQGVNDLLARAKILPCGTSNPTCAVRPAPTPTATTTPILTPTLTPSTAPARTPSSSHPTIQSPTTQPVNCGALPVGPGAGPPPAACSGLP